MRARAGARAAALHAPPGGAAPPRSTTQRRCSTYCRAAPREAADAAVSSVLTWVRGHLNCATSAAAHATPRLRVALTVAPLRYCSPQLDRFVVGLNLCPFAREARPGTRVVASAAAPRAAMLAALEEEARLLAGALAHQPALLLRRPAAVQPSVKALAQTAALPTRPPSSSSGPAHAQRRLSTGRTRRFSFLWMQSTPTLTVSATAPARPSVIPTADDGAGAHRVYGGAGRRTRRRQPRVGCDALPRPHPPRQPIGQPPQHPHRRHRRRRRR